MNLVDRYCDTTHQKLLKYELIAKEYSKSNPAFKLEHKINLDNYDTYDQLLWTVSRGGYTYTDTSNNFNRRIVY